MKINIVKQSETFRRSYTFRKADTKEYLDLTGCSVYSQMRSDPGGTIYGAATCTIDNGIGRVSVLWTSEQTAAMPLGNYMFDVWLKYGDEQKPFVTEAVKVVKTLTVIEGE